MNESILNLLSNLCFVFGFLSLGIVTFESSLNAQTASTNPNPMVIDISADALPQSGFRILTPSEIFPEDPNQTQ